MPTEIPEIPSPDSPEMAKLRELPEEMIEPATEADVDALYLEAWSLNYE